MGRVQPESQSHFPPSQTPQPQSKPANKPLTQEEKRAQALLALSQQISQDLLGPNTTNITTSEKPPQAQTAQTLNSYTINSASTYAFGTSTSVASDKMSSSRPSTPVSQTSYDSQDSDERRERELKYFQQQQKRQQIKHMQAAQDGMRRAQEMQQMQQLQKRSAAVVLANKLAAAHGPPVAAFPFQRPSPTNTATVKHNSYSGDEGYETAVMHETDVMDHKRLGHPAASFGSSIGGNGDSPSRSFYHPAMAYPQQQPYHYATPPHPPMQAFVLEEHQPIPTRQPQQQQFYQLNNLNQPPTEAPQAQQQPPNKRYYNWIGLAEEEFPNLNPTLGVEDEDMSQPETTSQGSTIHVSIIDQLAKMPAASEIEGKYKPYNDLLPKKSNATKQSSKGPKASHLQPKSRTKRRWWQYLIPFWGSSRRSREQKEEEEYVPQFQRRRSTHMPQPSGAITTSNSFSAAPENPSVSRLVNDLTQQSATGYENTSTTFGVIVGPTDTPVGSELSGSFVLRLDQFGVQLLSPADYYVLLDIRYSDMLRYGERMGCVFVEVGSASDMKGTYRFRCLKSGQLFATLHTYASNAANFPSANQRRYEYGSEA